MKDHKTILAVDDDYRLLEAFRRRIEHAGYRVLTAKNGAEALQRVQDACVDVITLDVGLPGALSGLDVACKLQQDPNTAAIPIIFITGTADAEFKCKCMSAGGKYFLAKPYDSDLLLQILRTIFGEDELTEARKISQAKRRQPTE